MKTIILFLFISISIFGQSGKNVWSQALEDSVRQAISDSVAVANSNTSDSLTALKNTYRLSLNNALLYDVTMDSNGDSVYGHWVFDTEFANYYDIDSVGYDLSGNGNNLTNNFSADDIAFGMSPIYSGGNSIPLDGSTSVYYINPPNETDFEVYRNSFTIEAWINTNSTELQYIVSKHSASYNYLFTIREVTGVIKLKLTTLPASEEIYANTDISDGEWHYVVCVVDFDNNTVEFYVDGVDDNNTAYNISDITSIACATEPFCIGAIDNAGTNSFNGFIGEVRFSKRVLSATEILAHYKKTQHLYGKRYIALAESYRLRVEKDGGTIISMNSIESAYNLGVNLDSLKFWGGVQFGVKYDGNNKVTKLYDLSNNENDLVQTDTSKSFTFSYTGMLGDSSVMSVSFADTIAQPNLTTIIIDQSNAVNQHWVDGITADLRENLFSSNIIKFYSGDTNINTVTSAIELGIYSLRWDTTDSLFVNSVFDTSANSGSYGLSGIVLGASYEMAGTFNGIFKELMISNDATIREIIETNMNSRWSIY